MEDKKTQIRVGWKDKRSYYLVPYSFHVTEKNWMSVRIFSIDLEKWEVLNNQTATDIIGTIEDVDIETLGVKGGLLTTRA